MAQYCPLCGNITNCTEDCDRCLKEVEAEEIKEEELNMYKIQLTIYPITDYSEDLKQVEPIEVSYEGNDAYQMKADVDDIILRTMNNSNDTKAFVEFLMEHDGEYYDHDEQWIYVDTANNRIKHEIE